MLASWWYFTISNIFVVFRDQINVAKETTKTRKKTTTTQRHMDHHRRISWSFTTRIIRIARHCKINENISLDRTRFKKRKFLYSFNRRNLLLYKCMYVYIFCSFLFQEQGFPLLQFDTTKNLVWMRYLEKKKKTQFKWINNIHVLKKG